MEESCGRLESLHCGGDTRGLLLLGGEVPGNECSCCFCRSDISLSHVKYLSHKALVLEGSFNWKETKTQLLCWA